MSSPLVPVRRRRDLPGRFRWPERPVLASPSPDDLVPLELLARTLRRRLGARPRIERNAFGPADLRVRRDPRIADEEGYRLEVRPEGCELRARTSAGAFYGLQTLRELVRADGETTPATRIDDAPDLRRRGVYLDCSRGKVPTTETLVELVEWLAGFKVNELQLYVENVFRWRRHPAIGRGFDPFRPEDLLAVGEACRRHHVRLVPSLASFGHLERVLGLPAYRHLAELPGHLGLPGGTTLCPGDPGSIRLVEELWEEVLPLFEADEVNACGDETWELGRGRSRRRAERLGTGRVYLDFVKKLHRLSERHGKRLAIWSDIVLNHPETIEEVPRDVLLLNWEYAPDGPRIARSRELADAGLSFLACPGTHGWQSHGTRFDTAVANVARFAREARRRRADGLLNTDWGDYGHRNPLGASLHGFAHGAAHAWGGARVDDATFPDRFARRHLGLDGDVLRTLGRADAEAGASLYHALTESLDGRRHLSRGLPRLSPSRVPPGYRRTPIGDADPEGCRRVLDGSAEIVAAVRTVRGEDAFVRRARDELALAANLDALAARRVLVGRAVREGDPSARDRRALATETERVATRFERVWLARNRPSRLRDGMRLFRLAAEDARG
jgi:hexosaminidase